MMQTTGPSSPQETRGRFGRWMIIGAWILFLVLLTLLFSEWLQTRSNPNRSLTVVTDTKGEQVVTLKPNRAGHYLAPGKINDLNVTFLLDTGATRVAVPGKLAKKADLPRGIRSQSQTASGVVESWLTRIERLRLGPFEMRDVRAVIIPDMPGEEVLLGMSFLKHLELVQTGERLRLRLPD
ncbi:MAG: retropepsin-like aspartic protease [Chromatiales bacterium]|jgi:aspartyl protease family protein